MDKPPAAKVDDTDKSPAGRRVRDSAYRNLQKTRTYSRVGRVSDPAKKFFVGAINVGKRTIGRYSHKEAQGSQPIIPILYLFVASKQREHGSRLKMDKLHPPPLRCAPLQESGDDLDVSHATIQMDTAG